MTQSANLPDDANSLESRLKTLIRQRGPISITDFMIDALSHPHEGYYMNTNPIGQGGDFTTAPEISQIFGEIIGLWLLQSWIDMGSPKSFNLVELGPGRGVLMADILRAARLRPEFISAAHIWLVETSGRLRHEQQKTLRIHKDAKINWADRVEDIPPAPCLMVANEFFDCLPIRQFERQHLGWHERYVGLDHKDQLSFITMPAPTHVEHPLANNNEAKPGDIIELCQPALEVTSTLTRFLLEHGGHALIIDYGNYSSSFGDSLQAVRDHQYWPVLKMPGKADITAHVDFQRLLDTALHEGASVYGPQAQGRFLDRLGLSFRIEALCRNKTQEQQDTIRAGAERIASSSQMGELFKVLCISSPNLTPPAGFELT